MDSPKPRIKGTDKMTVTETTSTEGHYKVFSSALTATATTAFTEVINELEQHNIPLNQTKFQLVTDGQSTPKYMLIAICRR